MPMQDRLFYMLLGTRLILADKQLQDVFVRNMFFFHDEIFFDDFSVSQMPQKYQNPSLFYSLRVD